MLELPAKVLEAWEKGDLVFGGDSERGREGLTMKARIWCDKCGWSLENQSVTAWFNKHCPECDHIVVNEGDMIFFRFCQALLTISKIYKFFHPKAKMTQLRLSSAEAHQEAEGCKKGGKR